MKKILININPWQQRVAILQEKRLQNIYFAAHTQQVLERSFFKGVVNKVFPGIQTAFVDIGQERAGFLHISEIDQDLALGRMEASFDDEQKPKRQHAKKQFDISKIFKEGEEILVQVSKEPVYEKGAKLTTCFTIPGRFFVLMPTLPRIGISKKIGDQQERNRLRTIIKDALPEGMGGIIRTTGEGADERMLRNDLNYLVRTWELIQKKFKTAQPQERLYEDIDLALQIVRDHLGDDVETVIVDDPATEKKVSSFIARIAPEYVHKVALYTSDVPLFTFFDIEPQIDAALHKKVYLKSGGSLIIESTEAMTVIDVNTGRFIGKKSLENTILKTNLEAAEEVVAQLVLRNIGGLIVIDFIDMSIEANRRKLMSHFEQVLKEQDRFQSVVLKVSEFGLVQMTRKRSGKTLVQQLTDTCPQCKGLGFIESLPTTCFTLLRQIRAELAHYKAGDSVIVRLHPDMFNYIVNTEYNALLALEKQYSIQITTARDGRISMGTYKITKK
jgi:ribonuclease G